MKQNLLSCILSLLMLGGALSFSLVLAVPPEPNFQQFYGIVTGADEVLSVTAQVGSKSFEAAIVDGEYGKDTPFLVEGKEGDMINFFIDDVQVETYILTIGEVTSLDLELKEESTTGTDEITSTEDKEALISEEQAGGTTTSDNEPAPSEGELGEGEATTDISASTESTDEIAGSETEAEEPNLFQLKEETKEVGSSNLFTWLIIIGAAFLLGVAVLLLVFWKKGQPKLISDSNELFYGETCKHPFHQQYPVHKHERPAEVCQVPEHKNYPLHRH